MFKRHGGGVDDDRGASGVGRPVTVMMEDTQGEPRQDNPRQASRSKTRVKYGAPQTPDLQT